MLVWLCASILFLMIPKFVNRILFRPNKVPPIKIDEKELFTQSGINMMFYDRGIGAPIVIQSHGNKGSIFDREHYLEYFDGCSLLLYDYRGFGRSQGNTTTKSILDDGEDVLNYVFKHYPNRKVILWGKSIGSSVAWYLASKYNVDGLIITSGFAKLKDVISAHAGNLIAHIISKLMFLPDNTIHFKNVMCPVLIMHAIDDKLVKISHAHMLINNNTTFVKTKGEHNFDLLQYKSHISEYLNTIDVV